MGINKLTFGGRELINLTDATVTTDTLEEGVTAYGATGDRITGTGLPGRVRYDIEQSLTKEEKARAQSNLGIETTKAFYITIIKGNNGSYTADKTAAEILDAYKNGCTLFAVVDTSVESNRVLPLEYTSNMDNPTISWLASFCSYDHMWHTRFTYRVLLTGMGPNLEELYVDYTEGAVDPPVTSVNGMTGNVEIAVEGVGVHIGTEAPADESITLWVDTDAEAGGGGGAVDIDASLSVEGAAADAKAVGDALSKKESTIPKLTETQKSEIHALAEAYYKGRTNFYYDYNIVRNDLANNRCWNSHDNASDQFGLCCNVFVELLWMGRKSIDFIGKDGASYNNAVNKAFEWGYMFNFDDRRAIAGAAKRDENGKVTDYYNFVQPNGDDTWSYSVNSRYDSTLSDEAVASGKFPHRQWFHAFMTADCMAQELYRMGCEIPYDELDVGDIIFTKKRWKDSSEEQTYLNDLRWRNISHVLMVFEKDDDGTLTFIDCTYRLPGKPFLKCSVKSSDKWDAARAIDAIGNVAMCARHPAAFGKDNMANINRIDYLPMSYQSGLSTGQAIPFAPNDAVVKDLWYVYNNNLGQARDTGTASDWNDANFIIQYTNAT